MSNTAYKINQCESIQPTYKHTQNRTQKVREHSPLTCLYHTPHPHPGQAKPQYNPQTTEMTPPTPLPDGRPPHTPEPKDPKPRAPNPPAPTCPTTTPHAPTHRKTTPDELNRTH